MRNDSNEDQKSRFKKEDKKILDGTSKSLSAKKDVIGITQQGIKLLKDGGDMGEDKPIYKKKDNIDKNIIIINSFISINK